MKICKWCKKEYNEKQFMKKDIVLPHVIHKHLWTKIKKIINEI
jgi:hypothetical protein